MEAKVTLQEIDRSIRVPSFAGVSGAIVIEATKGPTDRATLVTNDSQLLSRYTPDETVKIGYDLGYYSALAFLENSTSLWVQRLVKDALFGGAIIRTASSNFLNGTLGSGLVDPTAYQFDGSIDQAEQAHIRTLQYDADSAGSLAGTYHLLNSPTTQYYVWFTVDMVGADPAVSGKTGIPVNVAENDSASAVASAARAAIDALADFAATALSDTVTVTNAAVGPIAPESDVDSGVAITVTQQGQVEVDEADESLLIYQSNPGAWGDQVAIKLVNYTDNVDLVKQPNTFAIQVFKSTNLNVPVETHFCSREPGALNGFRRNIFVEEVLKASNFIRAISNPLIAPTVLPKSQLTALALGGGDDGVAPGVSDRIQAIQSFANPESIRVTILMDGGYAVPSYQRELDSIAQGRKDCVAILSTPFAAEDNSDYLNEITDYRDVQLNINSSWSALYAGYCLIQDRFNEREIYISPDGYVAGAISASAANYELWFPAAGFKRGRLTTVIDVRRRFEEGERDLLYDKGINPIRFFAGRGIVIWGQKTLSSIPSALDRLNVRLLLVVIGPALKEFLENFLFDLNEIDTRSDILGGMTSYMDKIQARKGVTSYLPVCDDSNNTAADVDANRLVVDLYLKPTRSIEDIPLRMIVVSTDADLG